MLFNHIRYGEAKEVRDYTCIVTILPTNREQLRCPTRKMLFDGFILNPDMPFWTFITDVRDHSCLPPNTLQKQVPFLLTEAMTLRVATARLAIGFAKFAVPAI